MEVEAIDEYAVDSERTTQHSKSNADWISMMKEIRNHSQPLVIRNRKQTRKLAKSSERVQPAHGDLEKDEPGEHNEKAQGQKTTSLAASGSTTNLELIEDFCHHFQIPQSIRPSSICVGYIKDLGLHRFYLPSSSGGQPSGKQNQRSLAEIITWVSEDEISRTLPRATIAHLACSLAAAVLQYHSTP